MSMPKNPLKVYFVGKRDGEKHDGVMTVATEVQEDGKTLRLGFAFCSKEDRFERKEGRRLAIESLRADRFTMPFSGHSSDDIVEFFKRGRVDMDERHLDAPTIWRHRSLACIKQCGLTYLEKA